MRYLLLLALPLAAALATAQTTERAPQKTTCGRGAVTVTTPAERKQDRALDGTPLNPLAAFQRRQEQEAAEKHFQELRADAAEMAELSCRVSEDIEKNGQDVVSARIFERLDRIEKLVKKVRSAAKE